MRALIALAPAALLLAACASPDRYADPQREAQLTGQAGAFSGAAPASPYGMAPVTSPYGMTVPAGSVPTPPGGIPTSALAAAGIGAAPVATAPLGAPLPGVPAGGQGTVSVASSNVAGDVNILRSTGVEASPSNAAPVLVGAAPVTANPSVPQGSGGGISDSQDFAAVSSRETIEEAAARRQQEAAQYQVIQPSALPPPPADVGPNIVQYALQAPNSKGQEYYSRFMFSGEGRMLRNCNKFQSPDDAQREFLSRGGPDRDPLGLDPDGDGFACAWDPAPFRAAVGRG